MASPLSPHDGGSVRNADRRDLLRALTLVELLVVIAILGVLTAAIFGAAHGARENGRRRQATAELAVLVGALEAYRAQYGDFPATGGAADSPIADAVPDDGPGILFNALVGRRGVGGAPIRGVCFVRLSAHSLQTGALPEAADTAALANAFLDPWGNRYLYLYRTGPAWTARTPMLCSAGPDGRVVVPDPLAGWAGGELPAVSANDDNLSSR